MDMWSGTDYKTSYIHKKGRATMPGTPKLPEGITPADHVPGPRQGEWTYSHYAALPNDGHRYEILDGVLYMAPAPISWHQLIAMSISFQLYTYITMKDLGNVMAAPLDVELSPQSVVQPDLAVLLHGNPAELIATRIKGTPDLVVEILSPSTVEVDRQLKYQKYARAGVKEYWIVDPNARTIEVFVLEGHVYQTGGVFSGTQIVRSKVISDFPVQARQLFHISEPPSR
jgi:Uma2 family endonuclease